MRGKTLCLLAAVTAAPFFGVSAADGSRGGEILLRPPAVSSVVLTRSAETGTAIAGGVNETMPGMASQTEKLAELGVEGFITEKDMPRGVTYTPFVRNASYTSPAGWLSLGKEGHFAQAELFHGSLPPALKEKLGPLFKDKEKRETLRRDSSALAAQAEFLAGMMARSLASDLTRQEGRPAPADIFTLDLRDTVLMGEGQNKSGSFYTCQSRIIIHFDGWVLPLYGKIYFFPKDKDLWQFMMVITYDEDRKAVEEAGDRIASGL